LRGAGGAMGGVRRRTFGLGAIGWVLGAAAPCAAAAAAKGGRPARPAPFWKLLAQSDLVVVGTPQVSPDELSRAARDRRRVAIPVGGLTVLKGASSRSSLKIPYALPEPAHAPPHTALLAASGRPAPLVLPRVDPA